jgi:hypothetical protein
MKEERADALMFATANRPVADLMSDVSVFAPAMARQVMFDLKGQLDRGNGYSKSERESPL